MPGGQLEGTGAGCRARGGQSSSGLARHTGLSFERERGGGRYCEGGPCLSCERGRERGLPRSESVEREGETGSRETPASVEREREGERERERERERETGCGRAEPSSSETSDSDSRPRAGSAFKFDSDLELGTPATPSESARPAGAPTSSPATRARAPAVTDGPGRVQDPARPGSARPGSARPGSAGLRPRCYPAPHADEDPHRSPRVGAAAAPPRPRPGVVKVSSGSARLADQTGGGSCCAGEGHRSQNGEAWREGAPDPTQPSLSLKATSAEQQQALGREAHGAWPRASLACCRPRLVSSVDRWGDRS